MQLRFTALTVTSLREELHLQVRAHVGRTQKNPPAFWAEGSIHPTELPAEAGSVYYGD